MGADSLTQQIVGIGGYPDERHPVGSIFPAGSRAGRCPTL
jgi:hypothetical protein